MIKKLALITIIGYQKTISPDHGVFSRLWGNWCRFEPTCSEYTYQAIEKYGIIIGIKKGLWRIIRCNPWNKNCGWDPVK